MILPMEKPVVEMPLRNVVAILGVPVDNLSMDETLDRMETFVRSGRLSGRTYQVATVNTDFIVNAVKDPETRVILQEADLASADGMPVVWAARLLGVPLQGRVAGADFVPLLAERAARNGFSIYFLGAAPGIAGRAAELLQAAYPDLQVAGVFSPPFGSILDMDRRILEDIKAADPDILLVAFGNPKQEKWIAMHRRELGVPLLVGVGGTLDFITGNTQRAPRWMQRTGLEWLHRLLSDPRRLFRRYVDDFWIFGRFLVLQLWHMRRAASHGLILPIAEPVLIAGWGVIGVRGFLTVANLDEFFKKVGRLLEATPNLAVDLSGTEFMDSAAVGTLIHIDKEVRQAGGKMVLVGVMEPVAQTLNLLRLDTYFLYASRLEEVWSDSENSHPAEALDERDKPTRQQISVNQQAWELVRAPRRFDAETAGQVQADCLAALGQNPHLILNLSSTVFLASAGLAVIAQLHRLASEKDGHFILTGATGDVLTVLRLVNFDRFVTLYPSVLDIPVSKEGRV
jgi:N-acetylglucosaminyldiphosphoundecaprenol N-acetyl-beta-D-mannosaminyltransferase